MPHAVLPEELKGTIVRDPEILGGTPCFSGTRVPLTTFFDYIESGFSLDRFLQGFSIVQREQALTVLEWQAEQSRRAVDLDLGEIRNHPWGEGPHPKRDRR